MTESGEREAPRPVRLALLLALFLVPGGVAAAVLWHDVLNELLAGRPARVSAWTVAGMALLLAVVLTLLARYLRGRASDSGPRGKTR